MYPLVEEYLVSKGLPIIGTTPMINSQRGKEIKTYLKEHNIKDFIIIDDEIFKDFDDEIINRLVKTDFYQDGLEEQHVVEAIKILGIKKEV